jgi:hypothetical protein
MSCIKYIAVRNKYSKIAVSKYVQLNLKSKDKNCAVKYWVTEKLRSTGERNKLFFGEVKNPVDVIS